MPRLLDYARLLRIPNVFTAMADIALGALAAHALPERWLHFLGLLAASSCLYLSGMVWNDYFDLEEDRRERPHRPLASNAIPTRTAFFLAGGLMGAGIGLAWLVGSGLLALILGGTILLYDAWLKRTVLGPVAMGSCRFLNVLLGLSITGGPTPTWGYWLAGVVGLYIVGVTWFARTEATDSNANVLRLATAVVFAALLLSLAVPTLFQEAEPSRQFASFYPYLLVAFAFFLGRAMVRAIQRPKPQHVQKAVKRMILGLVMLDAILASALVGWMGLLLIAFLAPAYLLGRWVYST